jgi:hypothetical protein
MVTDVSKGQKMMVRLSRKTGVSLDELAKVVGTSHDADVGDYFFSRAVRSSRLAHTISLRYAARNRRYGWYGLAREWLIYARRLR